MLATLIKAALSAQPIIMTGFGKDLLIKQKENHKNLLSEIDEKSQKKIREVIIRELTKQKVDIKTIGFIGEEDLFSPGDHNFIIDPLDGTSNYISKIPYFGVSIAYAYLGKVTSAVILDPVNNNVFYAQRGKGCYLKNGKKEKKLSISTNTLKNCLMNTYFSADDRLATEMFDITQKLSPHVRGVRSLGSGVMESVDLCLNKLGVLIYNTSWIWDLAGTRLIVEEAGGKMTDWQGKEIEFDFTKSNKRYPSITTHPSLISKVVDIINNIYETKNYTQHHC